MNNKYNELRALVYEIIYPKRMSICSAHQTKEKDCPQCKTTLSRDVVTLGEQLSLQEILRAIEIIRKPNEFKFDIDTKGYMMLYDFKGNPKDQWDFDLSLSISQQPDSTLEKLINILK